MDPRPISFDLPPKPLLYIVTVTVPLDGTAPVLGLYIPESPIILLN
jgi:hypothetical protein